jgi:hypothetical protein
VLYHWSQASALFTLVTILDSYFLPRSVILLAVTFCIAEVTGVHHHTWLICWDGGLTNFLFRIASNHDLPNLYFQVIGIIGTSHCAHPKIVYFKDKESGQRGRINDPTSKSSLVAEWMVFTSLSCEEGIGLHGPLHRNYWIGRKLSVWINIGS